ncbi:AAA family ATPase [Cyclobacterium salsum]|uniref:AAA family ATPase n=1 Tax=Cyclobacterium salsum TaxID=2666329 RepID=UPI001F1DFE28|nr:AAA family ATPase [Cyclobacterium salsum]
MELKLPPHIHVRAHYLNKLRPFIGKNIIKVLTGQRRVGKSYLLFQIIQLVQKEMPDASILYINKEDLAFSFINSAENLSDYVLTHKSKSSKTIV